MQTKPVSAMQIFTNTEYPVGTILTIVLLSLLKHNPGKCNGKIDSRGG